MLVLLMGDAALSPDASASPELPSCAWEWCSEMLLVLIDVQECECKPSLACELAWDAGLLPRFLLVNK